MEHVTDTIRKLHKEGAIIPYPLPCEEDKIFNMFLIIFLGEKKNGENC